jgi:hypothetical protein
VESRGKIRRDVEMVAGTPMEGGKRKPFLQLLLLHRYVWGGKRKSTFFPSQNSEHIFLKHYCEAW